MVNRELIEVFSEIAREKNVERSELGSIIESLFLHLVEKERGDASNCSVIVNLDKGEFEIYVEKMIVDDVEDPVMEITLEEISKIDSDMANDLNVGEYLVIECYRKLDPESFTDVYNDIFLKRYVTALFKKQWGANLSKFNGVAMLGGVTLNGQQIYTEALSDIEKLETEIRTTYELNPALMMG